MTLLKRHIYGWYSRWGAVMACLHRRMVRLHTQSRVAYLPEWFLIAFPRWRSEWVFGKSISSGVINKGLWPWDVVPAVLRGSISSALEWLSGPCNFKTSVVSKTTQRSKLLSSCTLLRWLPLELLLTGRLKHLLHVACKQRCGCVS